MKKIKSLYHNSYFAYLINRFTKECIPVIKEMFFGSLLWKFFVWFTSDVMNSKIFRLFFDMGYISELWYESFFYKGMTYVIRKISFRVEKSRIKFKSLFVGIFFGFILLVPGRYWSNLVWIPMFIMLIVMFLSHNITNRTGTVFTLINFVIIIFTVLLEVAFPYKAVITLIYLLLGIDFFFLVSFSVRNMESLKEFEVIVFIAFGILCTVGYVQNAFLGETATGFFGDGVTFGGILVILFPFAFVYPMEFENGARKYLYLSFIFILFLNVISATHSKAAFIGFMVEVVIFMATDIKLMPLMVILVPIGLRNVFENFRVMWVRSTMYGNIVTNIADIFKRLWNYGFGVNSSKFMSVYNSVNNSYQDVNSMISIPYIKISPIYKNIVTELGALVLFGFLYYILRLAHSALTMLFWGDKKYKRFFVAGLSMLVGISVSSFFESNLFTARTLLIYWGMIGLLRSVRIISLGVY